MDHKLIMENWRRFVDESEDMDPELVEEGLKELAASLVIGLGLATASPAQAGGSINYPFPHSAARSVPAQGQGQTVGLQDVKRYITSMYNEAIQKAENEEEKQLYRKALQAMVDRIDKIAASPEEENIGSVATWDSPQEARLVAKAYEQLARYLERTQPAKAEAIKKELSKAQKMFNKGFDQKEWDSMSPQERRQYLKLKTQQRSKEFADALQRSKPGANQ